MKANCDYMKGSKDRWKERAEQRYTACSNRELHGRSQYSKPTLIFLPPSLVRVRERLEMIAKWSCPETFLMRSSDMYRTPIPEDGDWSFLGMLTAEEVWKRDSNDSKSQSRLQSMMEDSFILTWFLFCWSHHWDIRTSKFKEFPAIRWESSWAGRRKWRIWDSLSNGHSRYSEVLDTNTCIHAWHCTFHKRGRMHEGNAWHAS